MAGGTFFSPKEVCEGTPKRKACRIQAEALPLP